MRFFATTALIFCAALLVGIAVVDFQQLPDKIASHFDRNGIPDGWSRKSSFIFSMMAVGLGIPAFVVGIMYSIRFFPAKFLNVPNPAYWRDPKHFEGTCDFLFLSSMWFGSAFMIWQAFFFHTLVAANQISPPRLDSEKALLLTIPLLAFSFVWMIILILRFLKTCNTEGRTGHST